MLVARKMLFKKIVNKFMCSEKRVKFLSFVILKKKNREHFRHYWENHLKHNRILIIDENGNKVFVRKVSGLSIRFLGKNGFVVLHSPYHFFNSYFELLDKSKIVIKSSQHYAKIRAWIGKNNILEIGKDFSSAGTSIYLDNEPNMSIKIGNDCMFSWDVIIRVSDGHTIYETTSKKILNKPEKNITIGNHVWLGQGVHILKNVQIADNNMVGMMSLVNKKFLQTNTIIAGQPAKVIKTHTNWDRRHTLNFENKFLPS